MPLRIINKAKKAERYEDPIITQVESILRPQAPVQVAVETLKVETKPETSIKEKLVTKDGPDWIRKTPAKVKTTIRQCIVIDLHNRWDDRALVDLKGMDTYGFSWGYYGFWYPVLVEQEDHILKPYYHTDTAGESSNRLFKAANPDGFRATFRHRSNILTKLQVGLMVALVLGLFFIMFILINWRG